MISDWFPFFMFSNRHRNRVYYLAHSSSISVDTLLCVLLYTPTFSILKERLCSVTVVITTRWRVTRATVGRSSSSPFLSRWAVRALEGLLSGRRRQSYADCPPGVDSFMSDWSLAVERNEYRLNCSFIAGRLRRVLQLLSGITRILVFLSLFLSFCELIGVAKIFFSHRPRKVHKWGSTGSRTQYLQNQRHGAAS